MAKKYIHFPVYDIALELGPELGHGTITSNLKEYCPFCAQPFCHFSCDQSQYDENGETEEEAEDRIRWNAMVDGIESFILAAACAGIDVETPQFQEAIETAVESCSNQLS